ncbi:DNA binding [Striga asiatica]|uniref:DNA binding n=1 Tax=Striga asiatica TaxID=4170 RepID=A0A5A7PEG4_STRAF|nr:DNA binding [Striga asiatica]
MSPALASFSASSNHRSTQSATTFDRGSRRLSAVKPLFSASIAVLFSAAAIASDVLSPPPPSDGPVVKIHPSVLLSSTEALFTARRNNGRGDWNFTVDGSGGDCNFTSFYGKELYDYHEELRHVGVMSEFKDACEYIGNHLMSIAVSSALTRAHFYSILSFI